MRSEKAINYPQVILAVIQLVRFFDLGIIWAQLNS
jgi:hypothetical protein